MKYFIIIIIVLNSLNVFSQNKNDIFYIEKIIKKLTSNELMGRPPGTVAEQLALDFISNELKKNNLNVLKQMFFYFDIDSNKLLKSNNVFTFINNKKDSTILISAHYDHLGFSKKKSYDILNNKNYHPGADDNASGVSLVLNLIKNNSYKINTKYNYLFVFFGAHEQGLFGSTAFCDSFKNKYNIKLFLNFDMVGRMVNENLYVSTNTDYNIIDSKIQIIKEGSQKLKSIDTKCFYENNIACISFTTGLHCDYHSVNDIESKINYKGIYLLSSLIENYIKML